MRDKGQNRLRLVIPSDATEEDLSSAVAVAADRARYEDGLKYQIAPEDMPAFLAQVQAANADDGDDDGDE